MTGQLWLGEMRRLVRSPYLWAVVVATLALLVWGHRNRMPNLAEASINAGTATFLVAATLMVLANLATIRDQRHGVPEVLAGLPGQVDVRTRAVLLAAGCVGAAAAGLVVGGYLLIALAQDTAAGMVDVREVAGAMAATALLAVTGVAFGRWLPSAVVVPVVVVMAGMCMLGGPLFLLVWNLPVTAPYLTQAYDRPAGLRLVYLAAAVTLLAAVALLRHGRRPARLGAAVAALAVLVPVGVAIPIAAPPRWGGIDPAKADISGDPALTCTDHNGVTYCHLPGFAPWVPLWAEAVEPVAAALPPAGRDRLPVVVQRSDLHPEMLVGPDAGHAVVETVWYRDERADRQRAGLAGQVAAEVTGLADAARARASSLVDDPFAHVRMRECDGTGQARTVVALWLTGQVAPVPDQTLRGIEFGEAEIADARAMLARDDVRELVWRHWDTLLDPSTDLDQLRALLGLSSSVPAAVPTGDSACR